MNILFVCTLNKIRSLTAEHLFSRYPGIHACSVGTASNARVCINSDHIRWADLIFVMEKHHAEKILHAYKKSLGEKKVIVLDIPNGYAYDDPELVAMLTRTVSPYLPHL